MTKKWTNPIKGLIVPVSDYGVGKTTFALSCGYQPNEIIFINDDSKTPPSWKMGDDNRGYKQYIDVLSQTEGMALLDFHSYCRKLIDNLEFSPVIIWDTWTRFEKSFISVIKDDPSKFRSPKQYSAQGKIKNAEMYQDSYVYEGQVIAKLKAKCHLLIITFHLKNSYLENVQVPGKQEPGHNKAISKYADLRLWLIANPNDQTPIGLVLKNIATYKIGNQGIEPIQVLPRRMPACNWKSIWQYWNNPIGSRQPNEDEIPNQFELSMIENYLTPEQLRLYEIGVTLGEQSKEKELLAINNQVIVIKEKLMSMQGSPIMKANQLKAMVVGGQLIYGGGEITPEKVSGWL